MKQYSKSQIRAQDVHRESRLFTNEAFDGGLRLWTILSSMLFFLILTTEGNVRGKVLAGLFFVFMGVILLLNNRERWWRNSCLKRTNAGRRFYLAKQKWDHIERQVARSEITEAEATPIKSELSVVLNGLWLEAYSQAGLVLDLEQLNEEVVQRISHDSQYLTALQHARQEVHPAQEEVVPVELHRG